MIIRRLDAPIITVQDVYDAMMDAQSGDEAATRRVRRSLCVVEVIAHLASDEALSDPSLKHLLEKIVEERHDHPEFVMSALHLVATADDWMRELTDVACSVANERLLPVCRELAHDVMGVRWINTECN